MHYEVFSFQFRVVHCECLVFSEVFSVGLCIVNCLV